MRAVAHRSYFLPAMGALVTLAWVLLWLWDRSPYGRYLKHDQLPAIDLQTGILVPAVLYVLGWTLMTVAMMLPASLPLLEIFRRLTQRRSDQTALVTLVIVGYLTVWLAFGVAAHAFDLGLHALFDRSAWLQANAWVFGAGPLIVAGVFQFTELKYRCLDKCRAPLSFVTQYWRGNRQRWYSLMLGVHHGAFCVGCCWALMLLMFAVGTGNVGWMLALGAIMAIEKNAPWGRKLSTPLGIGLLAWGALIVIHHGLSWQA